MNSAATIYVALVGQGDAWIPVQAISRADGTYEIISRNDDPEDENWQFPCGSIVHCEQRQLSEVLRLCAISSVAPRSLKLVWPDR